MITIATIFVVIVLISSPYIKGLQEVNNDFNNADEVKFELIDNEINNDNLIKLINKVTQELSRDELEQNTDRMRYKNPKKFDKRFVRPRWLNLHKKHGGFFDQLHAFKESYEDARSEPNDISKVYLVLDPEKALTSSDIRDLTKVVFSMFSNSGNNKNSKYKHNDETMSRYKEFIMRDKRRRFKDSMETFSKNSIERDYKPKRVRSDYGGGRTAIPYIGHRGDIYERE